MTSMNGLFRLTAAAFSIVALLWLASAAQTRADDAAKPQSKWAQALDRPGLPNLHKVNDKLYRGAQPEPEGYQELAKMGVKTVICLRDSDPDLKPIQAAKLELVHIPIKTWHPNDEQVIKFLKTVADAGKQPIYVHCKHGSDRTGTMCAIYRIAVDGWSKDDAIQEMTKGDFGFHPVWTNLIRFIRNLDMDTLKKGTDAHTGDNAKVGQP